MPPSVETLLKTASSLFGMGCLTGERMYQRGAFFAPQAFRSCGKVGIRVLDFHFSIAFILRFSGFGAVDQNPPELWEWGNLAAFARFPRN